MEEREPPHPKPSDRESRPPSRLLTVGLALLTLSALYLLGPAHASMNWAAALAVLLHLGLGMLLLFPLLAWALRALRENTTPFACLFLPAFALCALTGLALALRAAAGISTAHDHTAWWLHLLAGFLAVFLFGFGLRQGRDHHKKRGQDNAVLPPVNERPDAVRPLKGPGVHDSQFRLSIVALLTASLVKRKHSNTADPAPFMGLAASDRSFTGGLRGRRVSFVFCLILCSTLGLGGAVVVPHYDAETYYRDTTATNAAQAENPFFPAGVRLASESRHAAAGADYCGRTGCHETAMHEWQGSVHQRAATDPVYQRVKAEYATQAGATAARWCAGCHEPLRVVQSGGPAGLGGQEGVGCVACHAMRDVSARTGNGRFTLTLSQNYPLADRQTGWQRRLHDFLLRVRPAPHQGAYLKPEIHTSAEFCGTCHRQSFNVPQNGYQFVHGADEWGSWQSGPFSGRMARTAGLRTEAQRNCLDCHFPRAAGGRFSHASPDAGVWLPADTGGAGWAIQPSQDLRREGLSLDIFALRRGGGTGRAEEWIAPLDAPATGGAIKAGETCVLDIVVNNRQGGHDFPAGYTDISEAWLEVTLQDAKGHLLAESGRIEEGQEPLPPDTHVYRTIPLDRDGNALEHHDLWREVTTAYRRTIPAGGADIARYRLTLPSDLTSPLLVRARLRFRSLNPGFARWTGLAAAPIVTLAEAQTPLPLHGAPPAAHAESETALRFVDYGVGLLAPKDAPDAARARRAFLTAQHLAPTRPEPFLGLGRAYLAEPELLAARAQFTTALRLAPDDPAAQADLGVVYSKQGEYDHALSLLKPLALRFPQDGALQFDLGLTLFRSGDYRAAVTAFQNALAADPDNAAAHFQLKQCFQHLQRVPEARREEAVGQYLAEDRFQPLLVPGYLKAHPDVRRAAQPIPEHRLRALPPKPQRPGP